MLSQLFFIMLIFTVQAINVNDTLVNYPDLLKCKPTLKMVDASAKFPTGIRSGNLIDFGNFDQCLGIEHKNNNSEIIRGKYCLVKLAIPNQTNLDTSSLFNIYGNNILDYFTLTQTTQNQKGVDEDPGLILGWCVPHTCSINELTIFLSSILPSVIISPMLDGLCQTKEDLRIDYNTENIIVITFLALTLSLMIISTLYDMYVQHYKKKPVHIILIAFSVKTNGQKLLSISNNPDQLPCLNGIRCMSMMWVVIGHRFLRISSDRNINIVSLIDWLKNPINMYMLNHNLAVDTFFVLSGILVAYGYCLAKDKGIKFNIFLFYLHRYLRLTPVFAVIIWVNSTTLLSFFGSGPLWPIAISTTGIGVSCNKYWWASLLYIQNYYNYNEMCLGHTWYLSVDMQLFIIAPIILIPLWKWPKRTLIASTILVLASIASSFAVTYIYDLLTVLSDLKADLREYTLNYYYTTHTRYGPWLMGIMLGYYLFKLKKNKSHKISLHPAVVAFGWIASMGLLLSTVYSGYDLGIHPYTLGNSFHNGFFRHGWALGLCWVIYACTQGYGGPVNTFLSWSPFQILSRFTYTIYLVHLILQYCISAASRTHTYFSIFNVMYAFWGDLMMSFAISICLTLAFESPMVTIEKVLFKTGHIPKKSELPVHHNPSTSEEAQKN